MQAESTAGGEAKSTRRQLWFGTLLAVAIAVPCVWLYVRGFSFDVKGGFTVEIGATPEVVRPFVEEIFAAHGLELESAGDDRFDARATVSGKDVVFEIEAVDRGRSRLGVYCDCEWTVPQELIEATRERLAVEGIEMDAVGYPARLPENHPGPVLSELRRRKAEREQ